MTINKLQIGSFGKFKDYEIDFKNGFQVIFGRNEDGKTTLMAFIKMMFYSSLGRGKEIDKNMRRKYQPWDGLLMNGAIEFKHDGTRYRLQKIIGDTARSDKITLINMENGLNVQLGKNEEAGKRFFGLDIDGFERSIFINQTGRLPCGGTYDEVGEKILSNLVLSGDESLSPELVIGRLTAAIEEMESKNKKKGILVEALNELDRLRAERLEIQALEAEQKKYLDEYNRLKKVAEEREHILKLLKLYEEKNKYEKLKVLIKKTEEHTEKIKELEKGNLPYSMMGEFLKDCTTLLNGVTNAMGALEKLKKSSYSAGYVHDRTELIKISREEYLFLKETVDRNKLLHDLLKRLDESFIPSLASLIEAKEAFVKADMALKHEKDSISSLEEYHEKYQRCKEEINNYTEKKNKISSQYESNKIEWQTESRLREERINAAKEKLAILKSVKRSSSLLPTGIITAFILLILGFAVHPLAFLGVIAAFFIWAMDAKRAKGEGKRDAAIIKELKAEIDDMLMKSDEEERIAKEKENKYQSGMTEIGNIILELEKDLKAVSEKNYAYEISIGKLPDLERKRDIAGNMYNMCLRAYEQERLYLIDKYFSNPHIAPLLEAVVPEEPSEFAVRECRFRVEELYKAGMSEADEMLKAKSCAAFEEFELKYLKFASDIKNHEAVSNAEKEITAKTRELLNNVNKYKPVDTYENAMRTIEELGFLVAKIENDKLEVLNIARGMGYESPSLDYLKEEAARLEDSVRLYEEKWEEGCTEADLLGKLRASEGDNGELLELQKKIKTPARNLMQIQEEIDAKEKEVAEKTDYYKALKIALEVMEEASDEMRKSFGPELNKRTAEIFKRLTGGRYGNLLVTKDYDISVQYGIHFRDWRYFSGGTIDQVYLSLRFAIAELISEKNQPLPLFLDDVLAQYDDERAEAALKFFAEYADQKGEDFQLILFTCHRHIAEAGGQISIM